MSPAPEDTRQRLEAWLRARGTPALSVVETHTAVVAFTADRAFKAKKTVRLPFVDLTSREQRAEICRREVELNQRLAPAVYLGVVDITDAAGRVADHAIEMVRLPDDRRLDHLLVDTDPASMDAGLACIGRTAETLARFHLALPPLDSTARLGTPEAVERLWLDEISELDALSERDEITARQAADLALEYVRGRGPLFTARMAAGRIREGHGDLRTDSVFCLDPGPVLIDCLEFSTRLRCGDILADAAFLAMDLERLGHSDAAGHFLSLHRELTADDWPPSLAHHWIAYRAHVRAKVDLLQPPSDVTAPERSRRHLSLALSHLRAARVRLILVGGLPGSGKTTLSKGVADSLAAHLLSSDAVRVELFGPGSGPGDFGAGRYTPEGRRAVYDELLGRAAALLAGGHHVVIDASWSDPEQRSRAAAVGRSTAADLTAVECRVAAATAGERIRRRIRAGSDLSEADEAIADRMAQDWVPWSDAHVIDTGSPDASHALDELLTRLTER